MKSIQISRKSWLFRLALWGFYGWNWDLIDEIIDDVNHKKRWSFHRGRNFTTCDLLYGSPLVFLTALSLLILFVIIVILYVMASSLMVLFDIGRVLLGYKPAWTVIDFSKYMFKNNASDIDDFRRTDDWLIWRSKILDLRPIHVLAGGYFLYLKYFDSNPGYFNPQSIILGGWVALFAGLIFYITLFGLVVSIIYAVIIKYRKNHPKKVAENSPSLVKVVLQSVHEKTCRQLEIKD